MTRPTLRVIMLNKPTANQINPCTLNTTAMENTFLLSEEERQYQKLKRKIQMVFLNNVVSSAEIPLFDQIKLGNSTFNNRIYLSNAQWDRLTGNIAAAGFNSEFKETKTENHLVVSLPDDDRDDSGYVSDGWHEKFKASAVKKRIQ